MADGVVLTVPPLARILTAAALVAGAFAGGTASANCYGTQNTVTACHADREVYRDCVYLGPPPCRPISVRGPVCVYGTILNTYYYVTGTC